MKDLGNNRRIIVRFICNIDNFLINGSFNCNRNLSFNPQIKLLIYSRRTNYRANELNDLSTITEYFPLLKQTKQLTKQDSSLKFSFSYNVYTRQSLRYGDNDNCNLIANTLLRVTPSTIRCSVDASTRK